MNIRNVFTAFLLGFFTLGVGFYIWRDYSATTSVVAPADNLREVAEDANNISAPKELPPPPNLDREISAPAGFPKEALDELVAHTKIVIAELKKEPKSFNNWIQLGQNRKVFHDYVGAGEAWEYAALLAPADHISFNNLGELYAYYLKDYKMAEESYLKATVNGPSFTYVWRNAYFFFKDVVKNDEKAKKILEDGIKVNPAADDLKYLLNTR